MLVWVLAIKFMKQTDQLNWEFKGHCTRDFSSKNVYEWAHSKPLSWCMIFFRISLRIRGVMIGQFYVAVYSGELKLPVLCCCHSPYPLFAKSIFFLKDKQNCLDGMLYVWWHGKNLIRNSKRIAISKVHPFEELIIKG
jgi:hypothetical protein